jgi:hypothetical protein
MRSLRLLVVISSFLLLSCEKEAALPEQCTLKPETGECKAAFRRYYYDANEKRCKEFTWGGCGVVPFETLQECESCDCNAKSK